jgi:hypothetical protein
MNNLDFSVFASLFREVCLKCFNHPLEDPLTETESKLLYNRIFEQTGLMIGWKSLKNYSFFVLAEPGKQENPSTATLDTLARYVLNAPYTTEAERKEKEPHHPYWYRYMEEFLRREPGAPPERRVGSRKWIGASVVFVVLAAGIIILTWFHRSGSHPHFTSDFHSVHEDSLKADGWFVRTKDSVYWSRRGERPGFLTLFTLKGDNWPDSMERPLIRNLLLHAIPCDCWTLEIHLKDFIPRENWQQAGILLLEDTGLAGKSLRISFAYNDYNGGYPRSGNILIQAITSPGNGFDKPEEIAHIPLLSTDSADAKPILFQDLAHSALRIERQGKKFRILYAGGAMENTSFKAVVSHDLAMTPRYAGLFALKGFVDSAAVIPARFQFFSLNCEACGLP